MKVKEVRRLMSDDQKTGRRRKMCEDKRATVKVTQSPEKKIVCTIDINIKIKILNEGYK